MSIGILALQGGYAAHAQMLTNLQTPWHYVRTPSELTKAQGLILPGGESSTMLKLLQETGLFHAIKTKGQQGLPLFGTCAGAILLARYVFAPTQPSLELVDVTIQRNAYGRQLSSHITYGTCKLKTEPLEMFFIRAPRISTVCSSVEVLATCDNEPVCVQQNHYLLATFHPELTNDTCLHQHFINQVNQVSEATTMLQGSAL
ncbi:MAG TPA: pyridoxal 5'-phosphate synthase glutaminase subunit PdxT [Gammaproteobacteria bacterium]|nr:pyridoxal 5'-phosphate synthase glutaminase subunit PdxT [Gammaproteobacteria bacterium]